MEDLPLYRRRGRFVLGSLTSYYDEVLVPLYPISSMIGFHQSVSSTIRTRPFLLIPSYKILLYETRFKVFVSVRYKYKFCTILLTDSILCPGATPPSSPY